MDPFRESTQDFRFYFFWEKILDSLTSSAILFSTSLNHSDLNENIVDVKIFGVPLCSSTSLLDEYSHCKLLHL